MRAPLSPQFAGILAMSVAGAIFSFHDAITKYLAPNYPIGGNHLLSAIKLNRPAHTLCVLDHRSK